MVRIFNRPLVAFLDDRKVTIHSFNIVSKIVSNELEKGDTLVFETDEETSKYLCERISNRIKLNFKICNCLDAELLLHNMHNEHTDKSMKRVECEIQECEINSIIELTKIEDFNFACKKFSGKFVISMNDDYYILYRKSCSEYYVKLARMDTLDIIKFYLDRDKELSGDKCKISSRIDREFEEDFEEYGRINEKVWKRINVDEDFQIIY